MGTRLIIQHMNAQTFEKAIVAIYSDIVAHVTATTITLTEMHGAREQFVTTDINEAVRALNFALASGR